MKKLIIICFLLVLILPGCSLQNIKYKIKNSDNQNIIKKNNSGSDIFVSRKYKNPIVISKEEFEKNCPKNRENNSECNTIITERFGCIYEQDSLNMYYNKMSLFDDSNKNISIYQCHSNVGKELSSTLTDNNSIYILLTDKTATAYYNWDEFIANYKPIIDSESKVFSIIFLAGFHADPETEKQIKKIENGYLVPGVNYDDGFHKCMNKFSTKYKNVQADIIVTLNGNIKLSKIKSSEMIDCFETSEKPVIYLYPETKTNVNVKLDFNGTIIAEYPKYDNGWNVIAYPDGHLINLGDNKEYSYLFWEGLLYNNINYDLSKGFVVSGKNTREFLQTTLEKFGLTPKEYNEFIVYWYPKMKDNKYNLIHFAEEEYTDNAKLIITPKPDSILRVFMVFKALDNKIDIIPQNISEFNRSGFSVVEWGGTEIK